MFKFNINFHFIIIFKINNFFLAKYSKITIIESERSTFFKGLVLFRQLDIFFLGPPKKNELSDFYISIRVFQGGPFIIVLKRKSSMRILFLAFIPFKLFAAFSQASLNVDPLE
ncbi:hypothetical protein BpHYR1_020513 [Brachionus plicatilis]|uniref:Uncharacterized protein n=1 Tax=Brachionus plicatilis TaxID=10195 RepID=A0A3M7QQ57_BRAPC|nr:hypothetical protein BpHYR1_020513 [Brachionus plicatilis]